MKKKYRHDYSSPAQKLRYKILNHIRVLTLRKPESTKYTYPLYPSYRHIKHKPSEGFNESENYMTEEPTRTSGFGHGLGSWRAGYINSCVFDLPYAYHPMVNEKWDKALGLGEGERSVDELLKAGYKKVLLPYYVPGEKDSYEIIKKIIDSYKDEKVIFFNGPDQRSGGYPEEPGNEFIRKKFYSSSARKNDKTPYKDGKINVAVHVRRGDVKESVDAGETHLLGYWLDDSYYIGLLDLISGMNDKICFYLFSEGDREDFRAFEKYGDRISFYLNESAQDTFINMCRADLLLIAPSSFSREAGNINKNLKIASDKQKGYPDNGQWIIADKNGKLKPDDIKKLETYINDFVV